MSAASIIVYPSAYRYPDRDPSGLILNLVIVPGLIFSKGVCNKMIRCVMKIIITTC